MQFQSPKSSGGELVTLVPIAVNQDTKILKHHIELQILYRTKLQEL